MFIRVELEAALFKYKQIGKPHTSQRKLGEPVDKIKAFKNTKTSNKGEQRNMRKNEKMMLGKPPAALANFRAKKQPPLP